MNHEKLNGNGVGSRQMLTEKIEKQNRLVEIQMHHLGVRLKEEMNEAAIERKNKRERKGCQSESLNRS